jgi:hypothetical protein
MNLDAGRRGRVQGSADLRDIAMQNALHALTAGSVVEARGILEAALAGTYQPEDDGQIPDAPTLEGEGLPPALAAEIHEQAKTSPRLARAALRAARARLGTTTNVRLPAGARARAGNPYLPWGGREGAS